MTASAVSSVLKHWPEPLSEAGVVSFHSGFSGAEVWRIEVASQHFALRRWPAAAISATRLHGLHRLLEFCHSRGLFEFSVPLRSKVGTTLVEHQGRRWQLEPWMPGRASFHDEPTREKLANAMSRLAAFHRISGEYQPLPEHAEWFASRGAAPSPAVLQRLELVREWRRRRPEETAKRIHERVAPAALRNPLVEILQVAERTLPEVEAGLRSIASLTFPLVPCLRDIWHDHLLFEGDRLTGIIDPSACRVDNPVVDLSRLLGSLLEPHDDEKRQSALSAYQRVRPLSASERRLLEVLDSHQFLLAGLNWIDRLLASQIPPHEPERLATRLTDIAGRLSQRHKP